MSDTGVRDLIAEGEASSKYAQAGDLTLRYHECGEGQPVIMLHGGGPGASGWGNFGLNAPELSKKFRILILDMPGFGRSDKKVKVETINAPPFHGDLFRYNATVIKAFMDELGIPQADFVGNSAGGAISARIALDHPDSVRRLVLLGPPITFWPFSPWPSSGIRHVFGYYEGSGPSREKLKAMLEGSFVHDFSKVPPEIFEARWEATIEPEARAYYEQTFQRAVTPGGLPETWREIHRIEHPTLLIWGRDDLTNPLDGALFPMKQMPNARLYVISDCGHWAQLEFQEEFDRIVTSFLTLDQ